MTLITVLYYAGNGAYDAMGGYLCRSEIGCIDDELSLNDVMGIV